MRATYKYPIDPLGPLAHIDLTAAGVIHFADGVTLTSGTATLTLAGGRFAVPVGVAGTPSLVIGGTGLYSPSADVTSFTSVGGNFASVSINNAGSPNNGLYLIADAKLGFNGEANFAGATALDAFFTREAAAIIQMGADAAAPVAQTLKGADGSGANIAGGDMTLAPGRSTGTGAGGSVILATSPVGGPGSGQNALVEALRINSSQVVNVGGGATFAARAGAGFKLESQGVAARGGFAFTSWFNSTNGPLLDFQHSRSSTLGTHTVVQVNDSVGTIVGRGSNGTAFLDLAVIDFVVDGTPGATDMPGRIMFYTVLDNTTTAYERYRIDNAGKHWWWRTSPGNVVPTGNYEGLSLTLAAGSATFAAETLGTGTANIDILLTPAGAGAVNLGSTVAAGAQAGTLLNSPVAGNATIYLRVKSGASYYAVPAWVLP